MDLSDLDCPQYVCFETDVCNNNSLGDLENSRSSIKVKDDISTTMDAEDETSSCYNDQEQSLVTNPNSPFSEEYSSSSSHESQGASSQNSRSGAENFPVMRPKNLSLPENGARKNSKASKTTKVKPFNLHSGRKRKREDEYVSMAQQVAAFQRKTPTRFHTTGSKAFKPTEHWSPPRCQPKSPNLQAAKRARGANVLSHEEREEMEVEEMKKYKFCARPVNHGILQRHQSPKISKKPSTRPKSLQLRTAQRAAEAYNKSKEEEKQFEFHARPVPKAILQGPTGLKEKQTIPVTEPKTPNFALKKRAEKWRIDKLNETVAEPQTFKAAPLPPPAVPFAPKHEKKRTEIQPFSFDTRDKEMMTKKEQKIEEVIEKENAVYVFKAQPMPSPAPVALPAVPKKLPTQIEPFNFLLVEKSAKHNNVTMDSYCPAFKAQPANVLKKPPFIPEKSEKATVEFNEFNLYTDVRASERLKLKELNAIKEQEKELIEQERKKLEEEKEQMEIAKLRKEIVHKAKPIRHYKPLEIKPSSKPLTEPLAPQFKTDKRLQSRLKE